MTPTPAAPPRRRPMQAAPLAAPSVVVDTLRLEAQQRVTAWKSHERACPRCQVGDHCCIAEWLLDLAEDAGNRLERAIECERLNQPSTADSDRRRDGRPMMEAPKRLEASDATDSGAAER